MFATHKLTDSKGRYGSVSRVLHWVMAMVLFWIYCSTLSRYLLPDSVLDEFLWPTHRSAGVLLMGLLVLRVGWVLFNRKNRPPSANVLVRLGHLALYGFMFLIPFLGLLRQYGSGRAFSAFGLPMMNGFEGDKIEWMTTLGNNFHSLLGWTLLTLVIVHIGAVIGHYIRGHQQLLQRMIG